MVANRLIKALDPKPFKSFLAMIGMQPQDDWVGVLKVQLCHACCLNGPCLAEANISA